MSRIPKLQLKPDKEKSLSRRHPWIFSGALQRLPDWEPGVVIDLITSQGGFCARGFYNPLSQIAFRVLSREQVTIDQSFLAQRIAAAKKLRGHETAGRMFWSDADGLSGLVVDRFGEWLVYQILSAGMDRLRVELRGALQTVYPECRLFERSDDAVRTKEGLPPVCDVLPDQNRVTFEQDGLTFETDVLAGHKTGFYFDQRTNRRAIAAVCNGPTGAIRRQENRESRT